MEDEKIIYHDKYGNTYDEIPDGFRLADNNEIELYYSANPILLKGVTITAPKPELGGKAPNLWETDPIFGDVRKYLTTQKRYNGKLWDETSTYLNFRGANDLVARTIVDTALAGLITLKGAWYGGKGLFNVGKALWNKGLVNTGKSLWSSGKNLLASGKGLWGKYTTNPIYTGYKILTKGTPIVTSFYAADKAGLAVDAFSRNTTGRSWGLNISDLTGWPELVSDFTNPGYTVGGGAGYIYPSRYISGLEKRGVEMAMRTTNSLAPIGEIIDNLKNIGKKENRDLVKDKLNYLFLGKTGNSHYNSLLFDGLDYRGFMEIFSEAPVETIEGDIIDAALGRNINPKIGTVSSDLSYGILESHINSSRYPNKPVVVDVNTPPVNRSLKDIVIDPRDFNAGRAGTSGFIYTAETPPIDVAGHNLEFRVNPKTGQPEARQIDIWKFKPEDYERKWLNEIYDPGLNYKIKEFTDEQVRRFVATHPKTWLTDFGLRVTNDVVTPIIYRTPWAPVKVSIPYSQKPYITY